MREPMLVLLLAAGTVNFLLAEPLDGATLMGFVLVVIGISIVQEHRTESALSALRDLSSPRALVIRDGLQTRIPGREVVPGDVVLLAEGDRVPADGTVFECANFTIDESALTGESVPVRKRIALTTDTGRPDEASGGSTTAWVYSGTLVVKGHAMATITATGSATMLGGIGAALRTPATSRTGLQHEIDRLVRVVALIAVVAATSVVLIHGLTRHHWLDAVLAGVATAMAMLPEEFPVVLTVFLAFGAWRMSRHHVLTRHAPVIEALGAATVVCVDKTGTLTQNRMTVTAMFDGTAWTHLDHELPLPEALHALAEYSVLASPIDPFDPTDRAFRTMGDELLATTEHIHGDWTLEREYPLADELLALSHVWRAPGTEAYVIAAKGAPEAIIDLCHLDTSDAARLMTHVEPAAARGERVLGVAMARFDGSKALPTRQHDFDFEFLGLASLRDPLRPTAAPAVALCRTAGVRTVMITGDNPSTALAIAAEAGIDTSAGCVTGSEFATMTETERVAAVRSVDVFARMVPSQKLRLVEAFRSTGAVVAMTGDGVNDAPALKAADIGIAMGQHGTDVAREAADLVITDDDFGSIAQGIRLGRGIYDNARKAMAYIVAVHVPIIGMALAPLFVRSWPVVLLPSQIAFLELIIDPACSVVFEAEEIDLRIMEQPPRPRSARVFDRRSITLSVLQGCSVFLAAMASYLWAIHAHLTDATIRSITFATLVLSNLGLILVNRSWRLSVARTFVERRNSALKWILTGGIALLATTLTVAPVRRLFDLGPVRWPHLGVALLTSACGLLWFELWKWWHRYRPAEGRQVR